VLRATALSLCLLLPTAGFAEELQPAAPEPAAPTAPSTDQPTQQSLTPQDAQEAPAQGAVDQAKWCGMRGGCQGRAGKGKWIVIGGVAGTVVTAVAVGLAVGFATRGPAQPQTP